MDLIPKALLTCRYLIIIMKLQKQLSRKYGDKDYAKYVLVIKPKYIEQLGWKEGQELEAEVKGDKLVIEKD